MFHVGFLVRVIDHTQKFSAFRHSRDQETYAMHSVGFIFGVKNPTSKFWNEMVKLAKRTVLFAPRPRLRATFAR